MSCAPPPPNIESLTVPPAPPPPKKSQSCSTVPVQNCSVIMFVRHYGARWIQTMKNVKMHRYCYCSLPSWKYSQSHKQEQSAAMDGNVNENVTLQNNRLNYTIQSLHVGMQPPGSSVTGEQKKCWHMLGKKFDWFQTGRNICQHHAT